MKLQVAVFLIHISPQVISKAGNAQKGCQKKTAGN